MKNNLIIAHRGLSELYPENTLLAFNKAIEHNLDMIELDIHLTKDGELVVTHDASLGRTISKAGNVWEYSLGELMQEDAGSWKDSSFKDERVPSLHQVLELCKGKIEVNIEVKKETMHSLPLYSVMMNSLLAVLQKHDINEQIVISSFDPFFIKAMANQNTGMRLGLINGYPHLGNCQQFCRENNLYSYHPNAEYLSKELVKEYLNSGIKLFSWTAKDQEEYTSIAKLGVDGVITNVLPQ